MFVKLFCGQCLGDNELNITGKAKGNTPKRRMFPAILSSPQLTSSVLYCGLSGSARLAPANAWTFGTFLFSLPSCYTAESISNEAGNTCPHRCFS
jgi:hypothetical protein